MDLKGQAEKLKKQVEERRARGTRRQFDESFRAEVVAYVRARLAEGGTQEEAAKEIGLSAWTLSRWGRGEQSGPVRRGRPPRQRLQGSSAGFHPVEVKSEARSQGTLVMHGPGGVRVEGLSVQQVAQLLKELGC
jgi:transposase-like protein